MGGKEGAHRGQEYLMVEPDSRNDRKHDTSVILLGRNSRGLRVGQSFCMLFSFNREGEYVTWGVAHVRQND